MLTAIANAPLAVIAIPQGRTGFFPRDGHCRARKTANRSASARGAQELVAQGPHPFPEVASARRVVSQLRWSASSSLVMLRGGCHALVGGRGDLLFDDGKEELMAQFL
jgi:hypothetical protein